VLDRLPDSAADRCLQLAAGVDVDFAWVELQVALFDRGYLGPASFDVARAAACLERLEPRFVTTTLCRWALCWPRQDWSSFATVLDRLPAEELRAQALSAWIAVHHGLENAPWIPFARCFESAAPKALVLGQAALAGAAADTALLAEAIEVSHRLGAAPRCAVHVAIAVGAGRFEAPLLDAMLADLRLVPSVATDSFRAAIHLLGPVAAAAVLDALLEGWQRIDPDVGAEWLALLVVRLAAADCCRLLEGLPTLCSARQASAVVQAAATRVAAQPRLAETVLRAALALDDAVFVSEGLRALWAEADDEMRARIAEAISSIHSAELRRRFAQPAMHLSVIAQSTPAASLDALWAAIFADETGAAAPPAARPPPPAPIFLTTVLGRLRRLDVERDRFDELLRVAGRLNASAWVELLHWLPVYLTADHHAAVLVHLVDWLPASTAPAIWASVAQLEEPKALGRAVAGLCNSPAGAARESMLKLLGLVLDDASRRDRLEALEMIEAVVPLLKCLGGDVALIEAIDAIVDAGSLWP